VDACRHLAWLYAGNAPLAKDEAKAAGYHERACGAGDKAACVDHAWALARGLGLAKDEARAMTALDGLCGEGFLSACTRLGIVYAGKPAAGDRARAQILFTRACEGGQQDACRLAKLLH
jgi:TPR repeat protein